MLSFSRIRIDKALRRFRKKECPANLGRAFSELYELCVLNEFGYDPEESMV